jgi:hypothetical protein
MHHYALGFAIASVLSYMICGNAYEAFIHGIFSWFYVGWRVACILIP